MLLRLAVDENFNQDILRGVLRRLPELDVVSVQDAGLRGAEDPLILAWAAEAGRVLLSHDRNTMVAHFRDRISQGLSSPGLFIVPNHRLLQLIEDICLVATCSQADEWVDQCRFLPLG